MDYPEVVNDDRAAHAIATERSRSDSADTESLRRAMVHDRSLFERLVESEELGSMHRAV